MCSKNFDFCNFFSAILLRQLHKCYIAVDTENKEFFLLTIFCMKQISIVRIVCVQNLVNFTRTDFFTSITLYYRKVMEVLFSVKIFDVEFSPDLYVFRSPESKKVVFGIWSVRMYVCMYVCVCACVRACVYVSM